MPRKSNKPTRSDKAPVAGSDRGAWSLDRARWVWLGAAAIVLVGSAAYSNSLHGEILFDDQSSLVENPTILTLWPPWTCLLPPPNTTVSARPFVNFTLAANFALGRTRLEGYHALNAAIHILAGLALMGIVRRTLADGRLGRGAVLCATPLAVTVAMIWTLHPMQTESVSYLIQRTESLMGLMYLLTLYCCIRRFQGSGWGWSVAATACCAMGMASKEVMVSAPIMVLLYDRALSAGSWRGALRKRWGLYLALALTWGVLALCMLTSTRAGSVGFGLGVSSLDYLKTQAGVILHYVRVGLWPDELMFDYYTPIARSPWQYVPQGAVILALLAATGLGVWRNRPWGLLGAWFFLILGPTSSVLPIATEIGAEHRMYLPLAALVCGAAVGLFRVGDRLYREGSTTYAARRGLVAVGILASLAAAGALGYLTFDRNRDYRTTLRLWADTVQKQPDNVRALVNLGTELDEHGDPNGALERYEDALRLDPNDMTALSNKGNLLVRFQRQEEALPVFEYAIRVRPDAASAYNNVGVALMGLGRTAEALAPLRTAVDLDANDAKFKRNLAAALASQGQTEEACREYDLAIAQAPTQPMLYQEEGKVLADCGRWQEAADRYRTALRLKPDSREAMKGLAWLLATCPDDAARSGREALKIAQKLCGLPGGNTADNYAVLAAAHAECGDYEQAAATISQALSAVAAQANVASPPATAPGVSAGTAPAANSQPSAGSQAATQSAVASQSRPASPVLDMQASFRQQLDAYRAKRPFRQGAVPRN